MVWADQITHPAPPTFPCTSRKWTWPKATPCGPLSRRYPELEVHRVRRHDLGNTEEGFFATHSRATPPSSKLFANNGTEGFGYVIDAYGRGYNDAEILDFWERGLGEKMNLPYPESWGESVCTADDTEEAKCYKQSESEAYENAKAVARLVLSGSGPLHRLLVGNEGHLMTNEHCISRSRDEQHRLRVHGRGPGLRDRLLVVAGLRRHDRSLGRHLRHGRRRLDYALVIPDTSTGTGTDLPATYGFMKLRQEGATLDERSTSSSTPPSGANGSPWSPATPPTTRPARGPTPRAF
jgi:hypothetical protein